MILKKSDLKIQDVIGAIETLDGLCILPMLNALSELKTFDSAQEKLRILSTKILNGSTLITPISVAGRDYIVIYGNDGDIFSKRRIYKNKLDDIVYSRYMGIKFVSFSGKEFSDFEEHEHFIHLSYEDARLHDIQPQMIFIFNPEHIKKIKYVGMRLFQIYKPGVVVFVYNSGCRYELNPALGMEKLC